ncbi:MAG TPA: FAD-dependent oxidoreductase [Solirubrobacterales bacterium]|nr:FAD-dependent oxidoreductase [Solirubrobacterales bacterium]
MAARAAGVDPPRGWEAITATAGEFDVAVVGGGAAGLWTALRVAEAGGRACLVSRTPLSQSASFWAQGGLAAALEPDDSPDRHAADTIAAGRGLCRPEAVRVLVDEAPAAVRDLLARGVVFDLDHEGRLALGLEGGHAYRRIVHAGGSQTGHEITSKLAAMVAAEPRIEVRESTSASALWSDGGRCHGVVTDAGPIAAPATVLATGGAAALWRRTTNPRGAIGAGPVLAAAAGADLADLEFCQFHPTALSLPGSRFDGVLITEAVRGEGAKLLDAAGERFTDELAPRDAVTAAILARMQAEASAGVKLDLRGIDPARFPNVFASLAEAGLSPHTEPVPVAPAAHYTMGGVAVDLDGRSSLPGLFAVGECSCTGLHGANRLASNSLSECFVFGGRAATAALAENAGQARPPLPGWSFAPPSEETRDAVWRRAGPLRNPDDLASLVSNPYPLASATASCALRRAESRGGHLRTDRPETDPELDGVHFVLAPDGEVRREHWR